MAVNFDISATPINWEKIILASDSQTGGLIVGYSGLPLQRGYGLGSFLRSLFRLVAPVAKSAVKNIAREGLSTAVAVGSDALAGRNIKESLKEHGKASGARLVDRGSQAIKKRIQKGGNRRRKTGYVKAKRKIINKQRQIGYGQKKRKRVLKTDFLGKYFKSKRN